MTTDHASTDQPSYARAGIGIFSIVVGVVWTMELGSRGVDPGILFDLLPPVTLTFVGILYARKHLRAESS